MAAHKRGLFVPDTPRHVRLKRSRIELGIETRVSSQMSLVCLSNGYACSPKSVLLRLEHRNYLIGCGEGIQRILTELPLKFLKISQVLITREEWRQVGGILGLAITLNTGGLDELKLNAPFRLKKLIEHCRSVEGFDNLRLVEHGNSVYKDDTFTIQRFVFSNPKNSNVCFFVFDSRNLPGKLSVEKCTLLGVPANHCRARLKNGETITLECGKVVQPSDVLEEPLPRVRIVVIDFPDLSKESVDFFLEKLDEIEKLTNPITYFVHMTPTKLRQSKCYSDVMSKRDYFRDGVHLVLNDQSENIDSAGIYAMQSRLSSVDLDFFPKFPLSSKAENGREAEPSEEMQLEASILMEGRNL